MFLKRAALGGLAAVLIALAPGARGSDAWIYDQEPADNQTFLEQKLSAVDSSSKGRRSMFSWDLFLLNDGAFPSLSGLLAEYEIDRLYQEIPQAYFSRKELAKLVENLSKQGVQTVALAGDRHWPEEGLNAYKTWIDGLCAYNRANRSNPIGAVALDVESYTLSDFQKDPAAGFAAYTECMEEAYQYAHQHGLRVIQVIPTTLDTIDREGFEQFVRRCCDEITVMNYIKDTELASVWNEVFLCRQLGVPVETIFETMPLDDYYGVTEECTYYYDGAKALAAAVVRMQAVYGSSLGIAYHHYRTMYHVESGRCLAELYPYASRSGQADRNGQMTVGKRIRLLGEDGSVAYAWLYNPNLSTKTAEYCYLAVGLRTDLDYTIVPDYSYYRVSSPGKLRFQNESGKVLYTKSFRVSRQS